MIISKRVTTALLLLLLTFSTACVETVVFSSLTTGAIVMREKNFANTKEDIRISTQVGVAFAENNLKSLGNSVDVTVNEGRVLLTGIVNNSIKSKKALELAWKVKGVKEVIDEIQLRNHKGLKPKDFSKGFLDYIITYSIETKMLLNKEISTFNYQVTTVGGNVYLLGIAENREEMRKVLSITSRTNGVSKVINHIILINDDRRNG